MSSAIKVTFSELYRSAFTETDPHLKQQPLQQVQSLGDTWHCQERRNNVVHCPTSELPAEIARIAS